MGTARDVRGPYPTVDRTGELILRGEGIALYVTVSSAEVPDALSLVVWITLALGWPRSFNSDMCCRLPGTPSQRIRHLGPTSSRGQPE